MRPLTYVTAALATSALVRAQNNTPAMEPRETDRAFLPPGYDMMVAGGEAPNHYIGFHKRLANMLSDHVFAPRGSNDPFKAATLAQNNMCVDVRDNALKNGGRMQIWSCTGGANQQWRIEGPLFQTQQNQCLDLPGGLAFNGAPLQVWTCDGNNKNQFWTFQGNNLHWGSTNWCVDVAGGGFWSGNSLQLWQCYGGSTNQAITLSGQASGGGGNAQAPAAANTGATNYLGYNAISLDAFVARYPECAPYKGALQAAGADQGINPTFLGAIAMVESDCSRGLQGSPNARFGPFQFMDDNAWAAFGYNKDRNNFWDASYGAARYFNMLLQQERNNLWQAMRDWNGPVSQGGDVNYQSRTAAYMGGRLTMADDNLTPDQAQEDTEAPESVTTGDAHVTPATGEATDQTGQDAVPADADAQQGGTQTVSDADPAPVGDQAPEATADQGTDADLNPGTDSGTEPGTESETDSTFDAGAATDTALSTSTVDIPALAVSMDGKLDALTAKVDAILAQMTSLSDEVSINDGSGDDGDNGDESVF
ncbi:hypothetical protein Q3G72_012754 [Acer saccharum]|nr:hypothetical protein Q3G72_012754 [Acer saccharum]